MLSLAHKDLEANELVSVVRVRHEGLGLGMVGEVLVMLSVSSGGENGVDGEDGKVFAEDVDDD